MINERFDIHQHLTDRIVAAIEAGAGEWQMPWHRGSGGRHPVNVASGNKYRGVNVLGLWVDAQVNGYSSHLWGTYRQWAERGATVRKDQKASYVVFYKEIEVDTAEGEENDSKRRLIARATPVFNADQVDGFQDGAAVSQVEGLQGVDAFLAAAGAAIVHGGNRACFIPKLDEIHMPERASFTGPRHLARLKLTTQPCCTSLRTGQRLSIAAGGIYPADLAVKHTQWRNWLLSLARHFYARISALPLYLALTMHSISRTG